jgi:heme/copper-type cytochrome/quinol oxidase subunit 1
MPRRYKDYPLMYKMWQKIGTIGAIISLISGLLFIYLIYLQFKNKNIYKREILNTFIYNEERNRTLDEVLIKPIHYHLYPNTPILLS